MESLPKFLESELSRGRAYFSKVAAQHALELGDDAFQAAITRLARKGYVASPRRGFYLILRPEDRALGAPDPARWIDPLMRHVGLDYRVSLLRAAAFHGASHQAAMAFQVILPRQLRSIEIGRQRVEFIYQTPSRFAEVNRATWLAQLKTEAGFAQIAGVELTLLDVCRYYHRSAGIAGAAQVVHNLGAKANPRLLAEAARSYENSSVRRLGYFLELYGHRRQALALKSIAKSAKSYKELDPASRPVVPELSAPGEKNAEWMLLINVPVEIDP